MVRFAAAWALAPCFAFAAFEGHSMLQRQTHPAMTALQESATHPAMAALQESATSMMKGLRESEQLLVRNVFAGIGKDTAVDVVEELETIFKDALDAYHVTDQGIIDSALSTDGGCKLTLDNGAAAVASLLSTLQSARFTHTTCRGEQAALQTNSTTKKCPFPTGEISGFFVRGFLLSLLKAFC